MDISWLQDFLTLAETGNFTRAAAKRNISQAAFSRRIQSLEGWMGVQLVDRTSVPVSLTAEGDRFHKEAGDLLARLLDTRAQLSHPDYGNNAHVRIAMPHVLSVARFTDWWAQWSAGTGITVSTAVGNVTDIVAEFVSGGTDILICHRGEQLPVLLDPDIFISRVIEPDQLRPYVSKDHFANSHPLQTGSENDPLPLVLYSRGAYFARLVEIILEQAPQQIIGTRKIECDLAHVLRDCIASGMGIGWLPDSALTPEYRRKLKPLPDPRLAMGLNIVAFTHRRGRSRAGDAIWQRILESAGEAPGPSEE